MSLFSGDCQELAPCAVPLHQNGDNYGGANSTNSAASTSGTTSALQQQSQSRNPTSRKSSSTVIESDSENVAATEGKGNQQCEAAPATTGPSRAQDEPNDESKITPVPPSSVTR